MKDEKKVKKKKQKITYVDDGRTIADMSALSPRREKRTINNKTPHLRGHRSTLKEQWQTYIDAVRMMFLPMLVVIGIICLAFLIMYFLL